MATTYAATSQDIINAAFRYMAVYDQGTPPTTYDTTNALQALNFMLKEWGALHLNIWLVNVVTVPLVAAKKDYTLGPTGDVVTDRPLRVVQGWYRNLQSGETTPMLPLSQTDYYQLSNRSQPVGVPTQFYYQPELTNGVLYLYGTPTIEVAADYVVDVVVNTNMADISTLADYPQLPNEWLFAMASNLAKRLCMEYPVSAEQTKKIMMMADDAYELMSEWGPMEEGGTYFQPDFRGTR